MSKGREVWKEDLTGGIGVDQVQEDAGGPPKRQEVIMTENLRRPRR